MADMNEDFGSIRLDRTKRRLKVWRDVVDGQDAVFVSHGLWSWACLFLVVWLTFWTFGCTMIVRKLVIEQFKWGDFFFAIPFLAAELAVGCIVLTMIFGKSVVKFTRTGGTVFTGIGSLGRTRKFDFPPDGVLAVDKEVRRGSKGGTFIYHRLLVKTHSNQSSPYVVYSDMDKGMVDILFDIASQVTAYGPASAAAGSPADATCDAEHDEELRDRTLLAGQPPKQLKIARDMEGKIAVSCSSGSMAAAFVFLLAVGGIGTAIFLAGKGKIPLPALIFMGFIALFPVSSFIYALFGRRRLVLDHGQGEAFSGVAGIGRRTRFMYGPGMKVSLVDTNIVSNGRSLHAIEVAQPEGGAVRLCTTWSEEAKPYLAAVLRHPECVFIAPTF